MSLRSLKISLTSIYDKGQVGTIIEVYEPTDFEVEFVDLKG